MSSLDKIYWEYGQKPKRLIYVAIITILLFGFLYSLFPTDFSNGAFSNKPYLETLYDTQYFSAVTFTTLGYGDISPKGLLKCFAASEALFGAITLGFLVAGLAKSD
jgi:voltage-gated potassium channel Kch